MSGISASITGFLVGLVGLVGLFLASRAEDQTIYAVGLVVFAFAALFEFWLVKRWFDDAERAGTYSAG